MLIKSEQSLLIFASLLFAGILAAWPLAYVWNGLPLIASQGLPMLKGTYSWQSIIHVFTQSFPWLPLKTYPLDYPYITLWFYAGLEKIFGMNAQVIVAQVLFPIASFYLLARFFARYVNVLWAVTLAFTSFLSFSSLSFHQFLIQLIQKPYIAASTLQPLEISHYLFSSFSVFVFLLLVSICTLPVKLSMMRASVLSACWALFLYIHPIDALFGLIFWLMYYPIRLWRQEKELSLKVFLSYVFLPVFIVAALVSPFLLAVLNNTSNVYTLKLFQQGNAVSVYYYVVYFLIPIMLTSLVCLVQRVDYYEILSRFWHVIALMITECLLVVGASFLPIEPSTVTNRIPFYFLHFYYYIPLIYFCSRQTHHAYSHGIESNALANWVRRGLSWLFMRGSKYYLVVISLLLFVFAGFSATAHEKYVASIVPQWNKAHTNVQLLMKEKHSEKL
jgi:hypothetical protein